MEKDWVFLKTTYAAAGKKKEERPFGPLLDEDYELRGKNSTRCDGERCRT